MRFFQECQLAEMSCELERNHGLTVAICLVKCLHSWPILIFFLCTLRVSDYVTGARKVDCGMTLNRRCSLARWYLSDYNLKNCVCAPPNSETPL